MSEQSMPVPMDRPGRAVFHSVPRSTSLLLATVAVLVTGCAAVPEMMTGGTAMGEAAPTDAWCAPGDSPTDQPPVATPLPTDFVPVSVARCTFGIVSVPGDGEWGVREEQRADDGLDELTQALRQPSESAGPNTVCLAEAVGPIVITLTDARGRTITPAVPTTACGSPLPTVVKAIEALPWQTVTQIKLHRIRSQLEVDSGCPGAYKPVIAIAAAEAGRRSPGTDGVFPAAPASLRVCRYSLDPNLTITVGTQTLHGGSLTSAATLDGAALRDLLAALAAAPPVTGTCDRPESPFAIVFPADGSGPWATLELGGCARMLDGDDDLRQLDPATVRMLAG